MTTTGPKSQLMARTFRLVDRSAGMLRVHHKHCKPGSAEMGEWHCFGVSGSGHAKE